MTENNQIKKGIPKKITAIIAATVLVVVGGIVAFSLMNNSPKTQYFKAETNTLEFMNENVTTSYQPEFDWAKTTKEKPTENTVTLSGNYNGPPSSGMGISPDQIINNSKLQLTTQTDKENKQLATDLQVNVAGIELKNINLYLDDDRLMLQLPFMQKTLQVKDDDLAQLMENMNLTFNGESIDFADFFNHVDDLLSEDDKSYLREEYLQMIYEELSDDSFESANESVKIQDNSIEAEKLSLQLSEKEVKDLVSALLEKVKKDDRVKDIIKDLNGYSTTLASASENNADPILKNYEKNIDKAINSLEEIRMPEGITSTIWVKDGLIVKRESAISMGAQNGKLVDLSMNGTQVLNDTTIDLDYTLAANDNAITVKADMSNQDNELENSVSISADGADLSYQGSSTLKDGTREFEREISVNGTGPNQTGSVIWTGEASYDNDRMNSEHNITVETPTLPQALNMVSLTVSRDAKVIKQVDKPEDNNVKDLGTMSPSELRNYFRTTVAPQYQQWLTEIMGAPDGNMNGF
ncbi:hypothetical protein GCM10008983_13670 [Lentibacillus halophilus]|uniref:Uncharacterized protein n=1 Tax=Lentibacillus halophilus TaxID=295065 RepID=A0ABN0Z7Y3_9BACI